MSKHNSDPKNGAKGRAFGADNVTRLAKPMKKGIARLLFSRFLIIALLLALETALLIVFYFWLKDYLTWFAAFTGAFTVFMVIYLFNISMDSSARLTWMFIIALLPIPGAAMLWFTRASLGHRNMIKHFNGMIASTRDILPRGENAKKALKEASLPVSELNDYMNRSGCFPVYSDCGAVYFSSGEAKFEAMLDELKKAEKYIYLEYFIIEEGYMWGEILKILIEKAAQGVDVRVIYDGMCDMNNLPSDYCRLLGEKGIRAKKFSPLLPLLSSHYNYRDHRKILVIDGKTAFNGGVNLADEYINRKKRFGYWKDSALMIKGKAAESFTLMFLQMWNVTEKQADLEAVREFKKDEGEALPAAEGRGFVIPYADSPLDEDKVGETVYLDMLNRADNYVYIMTPYLILDDELRTALKFAAQRGVDVRIVLPGIPDKRSAYALAKSHYRELTAAGVKLYEFTPGFVHSKVFVCDGSKAVVGTINLDYRSLYHHFECATYLLNCPCIKDIEEDYLNTLKKCSPVTKESIRKDSVFYKVFGALLKFLAPLM